jgi:type I restriction enzyme, S subunit
MSNIVSLNQILDIQNGFAFDSTLFNHSGLGMPIIRIRDLARGYSETYYNGEYDQRFVVKKGDLLIGMDGEFRCYQWKGSNALLNQRVCRLQNFSNRVNPKYVYYLINKYLIEIEDKTTFVTVKHISSKQINSIQIPLPPLAEQERIVRLLDEAESLRKLRGQVSERMEEFIPALFHEMFGDPSGNDKNWEIVKVGNLLTLCEYGTSQKANEDGNGIPVLRMGNVTYEGDLDITDLKHVELSDKEMKKQLLENGDVLFNRTNSRELVGKTGMWNGRFPAVAASYFIRIRFDAKKEHPQHFTTFMNLPYMKRRLTEMARGAVGQANINAQELQSIEVPLPPIDLQCEFAQRVQEAQDVRSAQARSKERVEALYQSMLSRAFAGEL